MNRPTVYTLITMIRGFSNTITVKGLAASLGVSYSTLARCKNGVWPPSITFNAMRSVFHDCRDGIFGGDEEALVRIMCEELRHQDMEADAFETIYATKGFDIFLERLMWYAASDRTIALDDVEPAYVDSVPEVVDSSQPESHPPSLAQDDRQDVIDASAADDEGSRAKLWHTHGGLYFGLPLAAVLIMGLVSIDLAPMLSWLADHSLLFLVLVCAIALLPTFASVLIDAPIAWHTYRKTHPDAQLTLHNLRTVTKYGAIDEVVPGAGRADISWRYISYQATCNLLGALCYFSLLQFLLSLPGFLNFISGHLWVELLKFGMVAGFFITFESNHDILLQPRPTSCDSAAENPDNFLLTRAHVWANAFHLLVTLSFVSILTLCLIAYSIVNFRTTEAPLLILWPYVQSNLFFAYSCISPYPVSVRSMGIGSFVPEVTVTSVGVMVLMLLCYLPSISALVICTVCLAFLGFALAWRRRHADENWAKWLTRGSHARSYSIIMLVGLVVMLVAGFLTSTFA